MFHSLFEQKNKNENKKSNQITKMEMDGFVDDIINYLRMLSEIVYAESRPTTTLNMKEKIHYKLLCVEDRKELEKYNKILKSITTSIVKQQELFTNAHRIQIAKQLLEAGLVYKSDFPDLEELAGIKPEEFEFDHQKVLTQFEELVGPTFMNLLRTLQDEKPSVQAPHYLLTGQENSIKRKRDAKNYIEKHFKKVPDSKEIDKDGNTQLHWAAFYGAEKLVKKYLDQHADPTIKNKYSDTALFFAAKQGRKEVTEILMGRPDFDIHGNDVTISMLYMCEKNYEMHQPIIKQFLDKGISQDLLNKALVCAVKVNSENNVSLLVANGAKITDNKALDIQKIAETNITIASTLLKLGVEIDRPQDFLKVLLTYQPKDSYLKFFKGIVYEDKITPHRDSFYICLTRLCEKQEQLSKEQYTQAQAFLNVIKQKNVSVSDQGFDQMKNKSYRGKSLL